MPQLSSPIYFNYMSDADKTFDENIKDIVDHVRQATQNGQLPFKMSLELPTEQVDTATHTKLLDSAIADAIEMEENKMEPVSLDTDGEMLHKRIKKTS